MILATNLFVLVSTGLCMIDVSWVILIGRFLFGMASGAFTVFVPKFTAEISPQEYRGPFGAVNQFMCTFGIFTVSALGLPLPDDPSTLD